MLLAIVVGALFFDPTGWAVKILIILVSGVCAYEMGQLVYKGLFEKEGVVRAAGMSGWIAATVTYNILFRTSPSADIWLSIMAIASAPIIIWGISRKSEWIAFVPSFLWVSLTMMSLYALASTKSPSTWPLLMTAAIPIWCGDTAAIFVGKAFGKHKLAPAISPNKTWEGAIGNLLACVGAALALGAIFHYPMLLMVLLGINCGILGQAGDLFESWLKRKADVKDSGNILPGHGGLLDRLDSLMATAPISLLILQSLVVPGTHN